MDSFLQSLLNVFRNIKRPIIKAKNLNYSYKDEKVLKNFSFSLQKSQIVAVVGRSGEGKSTFLHLVVGVLSSGFSNNLQIMGKHSAFAKKDIGFVPQEIAVIPDISIEHNIIFFGNLYGMTKAKSLKKGKELMETLHLNVPLSKKPTELSGGQKVRLNIVVSFLHNPKLMILDEPFVGLDFYNRKLLWHFLEYQKNRRKAIVVTTHMLHEAEQHANQIVLLHKGKVFARGKLKDIREKLDTLYIAEYKFESLSKQKIESIKKYCYSHEITIMNHFNNYMMFSINREGQRLYLSKFFEKINAINTEISFREPNLDELFLKVMHV
ncbi:MAG: ABC transporter ATP-binding protein [Candidatus Woesearchaeota archaeon]